MKTKKFDVRAAKEWVNLGAFVGTLVAGLTFYYLGKVEIARELFAFNAGHLLLNRPVVPGQTSGEE